MVSGDDLKELDERLEYCRRQIEHLQTDARQYLSDNLEARETLVGVRKELQLRVKTLLPTELKVRVGTIVNELRSILDALACVLAIRNGRSANQVCFPIAKDRETFDKGLEKIRKLSVQNRQAIIDLQPWGDANPRLFAFHTLDIIRKHRRLALQAASHAGTRPGAGPSGIGIITSATMAFVGPLTLEWQTIFAGDPGTHVMVQYSTHVAFAEPDPLQGWDVILGLEWFRETVTRFVGGFRTPQ